MSTTNLDGCFTWNIQQLRSKLVWPPKPVLDGRPVDKAESVMQGTSSVPSVREWGERWLSRREREGLKIAADDRRIWRTHVANEAWAALPMNQVSRSLARDWWSRLQAKGSSNPTHTAKTRARLLKGSTLANIRQCVRKCFADAVDEEIIAHNPFERLNLSRARTVASDEDICFLHLEEQREVLALFEKRPEWYLLVVALYTGVRQESQWNFRIEDVDLKSRAPSVWVRKVKGGKPYRVYLFGLGLIAMREWVENVLPTFASSNPLGLVFPRRDGSMRRKGRVFRGFGKIAALIGRRFTWHGLRHSCATSLLGGWWGVSYSLKRVSRHLGHASVKVTERYARVVDETMRELAAKLNEKSGVTMSEQQNEWSKDFSEAVRDFQSKNASPVKSEVEQADGTVLVTFENGEQAVFGKKTYEALKEREAAGLMRDVHASLTHASLADSTEGKVQGEPQSPWLSRIEQRFPKTETASSGEPEEGLRRLAFVARRGDSPIEDSEPELTADASSRLGTRPIGGEGVRERQDTNGERALVGSSSVASAGLNGSSPAADAHESSGEARDGAPAFSDDAFRRVVRDFEREEVTEEKANKPEAPCIVDASAGPTPDASSSIFKEADRVCLRSQVDACAVRMIGSVAHVFLEGVVWRVLVRWDDGGSNEAPEERFVRAPRVGDSVLVRVRQSSWYGTVCKVAAVLAGGIVVWRLRHPNGSEQAFALHEIQYVEVDDDEARALNGPTFTGDAFAEVSALKTVLRAATERIERVTRERDEALHNRAIECARLMQQRDDALAARDEARRLRDEEREACAKEVESLRWPEHESDDEREILNRGFTTAAQCIRFARGEGFVSNANPSPTPRFKVGDLVRVIGGGRHEGHTAHVIEVFPPTVSADLGICYRVRLTDDNCPEGTVREVWLEAANPSPRVPSPLAPEACAHDENRTWSIASGHAAWCPDCGALRFRESGPRGRSWHLPTRPIPSRDALLGFVKWIAQHPDVGDSLTARDLTEGFKVEARKLLRGAGEAWKKNLIRGRAEEDANPSPSLPDVVVSQIKADYPHVLRFRTEAEREAAKWLLQTRTLISFALDYGERAGVRSASTEPGEKDEPTGEGTPVSSGNAGDPRSPADGTARGSYVPRAVQGGATLDVTEAVKNTARAVERHVKRWGDAALRGLTAEERAKVLAGEESNGDDSDHDVRRVRGAIQAGPAADGRDGGDRAGIRPGANGGSYEPIPSAPSECGGSGRGSGLRERESRALSSVLPGAGAASEAHRRSGAEGTDREGRVAERETAPELPDEDIVPNADDKRRALLAVPLGATKSSEDIWGGLRARVAHELADLRATLNAEHRSRAVLLRTAIGHLTDIERASMRLCVFLDVVNKGEVP